MRRENRVAREKSCNRGLDDGKFVTVWRAAERIGWPFGAIIRLLILTGCRGDEIGSLRWDEVRGLDGPAPHILFQGARTKTHEARSVPLSEPAAGILRGLPRFAGGFVFGAAGRGPFKGWSRARRRLDAVRAELAGEAADARGE